MYSIANRRSFEELGEFRDAILRVKDTDRFPMIIVGNKCDLEASREVTTIEGQELAKSYGCPFVETSAKTRTRVDECFFELVKEIRRHESNGGGSGQGGGDASKKAAQKSGGRGRCMIL